MEVTVRIPAPLIKMTKGAPEVKIKGANVSEIINNLEREYPGIKERLCEGDGKVRRFVNIFVNDEDIRFLQNTETALKDGDEVSIIPAIAGGALKNTAENGEDRRSIQ